MHREPTRVLALDGQDEVEEMALVEVEPVQHARHECCQLPTVRVRMIAQRVQTLTQQR